jgi:predicted dehydrogenase
MNEVGSVTRRGFIGGAAASAVLAAAPNVFAQGSDKIRVGVIGCGGRGSGAAYNVLAADPNVEIVALGDLFPERVKELAGRLKAEHAARAKFTDDTTFSGWDAYKKVLASNCNYVILATPPGFRPYHFQAAVEAGKNIFMEKPVAVDPNGVRKVIAASAVAQQKGLAVVSGTQRRHQAGYVETIKRIHAGAIGEVLGGQVYWNQGGLWMNPRQPEWDDMTWQLKNWLYFTWLSGDHIVE